jgi:hypothetical protein
LLTFLSIRIYAAGCLLTFLSIRISFQQDNHSRPNHKYSLICNFRYTDPPITRQQFQDL